MSLLNCFKRRFLKKPRQLAGAAARNLSSAKKINDKDDNSNSPASFLMLHAVNTDFDEDRSVTDTMTPPINHSRTKQATIDDVVDSNLNDGRAMRELRAYQAMQDTRTKTTDSDATISTSSSTADSNDDTFSSTPAYSGSSYSSGSSSHSYSDSSSSSSSSSSDSSSSSCD